MGIFDFLKNKTYSEKNNKTSDEDKFFNWLDKILETKLPSNIKAVNFNLYEDKNNKWSIELVGTSTFDENDSDWACDEIYTTRTKPFVLVKDGDWKYIEKIYISFLKDYLDKGKYSDVLKSYCGIGIGFVDGDLSIVYKN